MGVRKFSPLLLGLLLSFACTAVPVPTLADARPDFDALQEARLRSGIAAVNDERSLIRERYAARELDCLDRFFSASCLEDTRQGYARALRELELVQETLELQIRQIQAGARQRLRQEAVARHTEATQQRRAQP